MLENHLPIMTMRKKTFYSIRKNINTKEAHTGRMNSIGKNRKEGMLCNSIYGYYQKRESSGNSIEGDPQMRRQKIGNIYSLSELCSP